MRKNKIMWNIALFLIIIIAIPIVYAQTFFDSPIFFVLINSLIVGVILFLLQSFLIPQKNPKEQTAVWVAIIAGSLVIGFLFGRTGFLWQHPVMAKFFSIYVLVNAAIIAIVIYFLMGLLDINKKLGSPEGKTGYGILIFLVALIFAVNIGNQWIWQKAVVQQFIDYLFGSQGILNPAPPEYRLWAFITISTLLAFFFNGFLLKGGAGGTNKINYALAILIGTSVARAGISFASIVLLGEAIFTIVLAEALKGTAPDVKGKSTNWILAAFLVGWASAAMTYGTEYQGWLAWIVGTPLWAMGLIQVGPTGGGAQPSGTGWLGWIFKMGGGALVLAIVALIFLFVIGRGDKRASGTWQKLKKYGLVPVLRWMRKNPVGPIRWLLQLWTAKDPYFEGELPPVFDDLRAELMILMNYQTRLHTYIGKRAKVEEGVNLAAGLEEHFKKASRTYDKMRNSLDKYRFGAADVDEGTYGWSNNRQLVKLFFDMLKEDLENDADLKGEVIAQSTENIYRKKLESKMNEQLDLMFRAYSQFITNTKRFGLIHRLRSLKIKILDLLTLYGVYRHTNRFANENALYEKWLYNPDKSDPIKWDATPTARDKPYEDEKNKVINRVRQYYLNAITKQKIQELQKRYYNIFYEELKQEVGPKVRTQYEEYKNRLTPPEKAKITEAVINRAINNLADKRINEVTRKVEEEIRKRENEIKDDALFELEGDDFQKRIINAIPQKYKLGFNPNSPEGRQRHEVDIKGFVVEDFHKIELDHENLSYIKRVKVQDIEDFPADTEDLTTYTGVYKNILAEWDFFIEDLRFGTFHPFSRSYIDYTKIINDSRHFKFDNVGRTKPDRRQNYAAFDLDALKISGKWVYWGRRNYWDKLPELKNPYPTISTIGLSRFITELVRLRAKTNEIADKYLSYWVWDTSKEDQPFTTLLGKEDKK